MNIEQAAFASSVEIGELFIRMAQRGWVVESKRLYDDSIVVVVSTPYKIVECQSSDDLRQAINDSVFLSEKIPSSCFEGTLDDPRIQKWLSDLRRRVEEKDIDWRGVYVGLNQEDFDKFLETQESRSYYACRDETPSKRDLLGMPAFGDKSNKAGVVQLIRRW